MDVLKLRNLDFIFGFALADAGVKYPAIREVQELSNESASHIEHLEKAIALADRAMDSANQALDAAHMLLLAAGRRTAELENALRLVKHELMIPAAEYVPAIPAVWDIIENVLRGDAPYTAKDITKQ